ncbi:Integrase (fragment) [Methylocella tundrae]|uniref:Integrase n=1 Tax=Methylocella tundrae TaxID=227605 RepID=A0A8B6M657_METTU
MRCAERRLHNLRRTGNLRTIQILLGHTKIEGTVRYLGVDIEDALALSKSIEL